MSDQTPAGGTADESTRGASADAARGATASAGELDSLEPLPVDVTSPQLTVRAVLTGAVIGALLSVCNIYAALRVGISLNMSITGALLGYAVWTSLYHLSGKTIRPWGLLENNVNQTACSAGASVASAGLVTAIPALAILTGQTLGLAALALWVFSVCLVGIVVAVGLRRQMLLVDKLRFPVGIANAETLRRLHTRGSDAVARIGAFAVAAVGAAAVEISNYIWRLPTVALPGAVKGITLKALTFAIQPSTMLYAVGALIGPRAGLSMLVGAVVAFGVISPELVNGGIVAGAKFGELRAWLVWAGVTLMVVSALVSFAFSWRSAAAAVGGLFGGRGRTGDETAGEVQRHVFLGGLVLALVLSVTLQALLFHIAAWAALVGVLLSFMLALVAARASGETGLTPVASIGKITQLLLGAMLPLEPATNLMAANVTGGAASQCADLLHDLKCGHLLGASPRAQALAQVCGAALGALVGSAAYMLLVPEPAKQLFTEALPAPAAASWKAVAELLMDGFEALPAGVPWAMGIAAGVALVLTVLEKTVPGRVRGWLPSAASMGMAFVWPAHYSVTICIGSLIAWGLGGLFPRWTARFLVTICAGAVVGEALTGFGTALHKVLAT